MYFDNTFTDYSKIYIKNAIFVSSRYFENNKNKMSKINERSRRIIHENKF